LKRGWHAQGQAIAELEDVYVLERKDLPLPGSFLHGQTDRFQEDDRQPVIVTRFFDGLSWLSVYETGDEPQRWGDGCVRE
jgi:hypothetical protein